MSPRPRPEHLLEASIRFDQVPATGRDLSVAADAEQRIAIAERLGISAVDRLEAKLRALPFRGGIRVTGTLRAAIVQPCVVTFVPVPQEIEEPFDRLFLPGKPADRDVAPGAEIFVDLEEEDVPDHVEGPDVDLSEALLETLALAIDPYPRAPGVSLEDVLPRDADEADSPFAQLKSLKLDKDKS